MIRSYFRHKKVLIIICTILMGIAAFLLYKPFIFYDKYIKNYYADVTRPSNTWYDFSYIEEKDSKYKIIVTNFNPFSPVFSVAYGNFRKFGPESEYTYVDIVKFKRNIYLDIIGVDIVSTRVSGKTLNEVLELAKISDISTLPTSDTIQYYPNPTKEEWMKKLNEEKLVLRHSISNPSKTDSVDFSVSGDLEENEIIIKSLGKDMREFGITFNEYQRMLDKEDYTYWINDDEFIFLINNFNGKDKIFPTFDLIKDYKDGIYTFNTKTKEMKIFIPITEPDRSFRVDYELTKDSIIIFASNKTYTYDKEGKSIETLNN